MSTQIRIEERFCGPPDSGNCGYASGLLGGFLQGAAEVKLLFPPPLNRVLDIDAQNSAMSEDKLQDYFFPTCFVCGQKRNVADGFRIFPGPVAGRKY